MWTKSFKKLKLRLHLRNYLQFTRNALWGQFFEGALSRVLLFHFFFLFVLLRTLKKIAFWFLFTSAHVLKRRPDDKDCLGSGSNFSKNIYRHPSSHIPEEHHYFLWRTRCDPPTGSCEVLAGEGRALLGAETDSELESLLPLWCVLPEEVLFVKVLKCCPVVLGVLKLESSLPRLDPAFLRTSYSRIEDVVPCVVSSTGSELPWQRVPQWSLSRFQARLMPAENLSNWMGPQLNEWSCSLVSAYDVVRGDT